MNKNLIALMLTGSVGIIPLHSQEVIGTCGNEQVSETGVNLSWTIGEVVIPTLSGESTVLTEGFHQSLFNFSNVEENSLIDILLYPNPTTDEIRLQLSLSQNPVVAVFDLRGKQLLNVTYSSHLDVSLLESGIYYLKINAPYDLTLKFEKL